MTEAIDFFIRAWSGDAIRYLYGVGGVTLILFIFMRRFSARRKIQRREATGKDVLREFSRSIGTTVVYSCTGLFFFIVLKIDTAVYRDWGDYPLLYNIISLPLILVIHDAYFYWIHRTIHHPKLFRRFHLVHHKSRTPTPWAAYSFAVGEAVLMGIFVPLVIWFIPFHPLVIFAFLTFMIVRNAMGHSGIEFHPRWWVDTPWNFLTTVTHHDLHHQRVNGHYGLYFTWWDRWMGTEFPDYKERFREAATPTPLPGEEGGAVKAPAE